MPVLVLMAVGYMMCVVAAFFMSLANVLAQAPDPGIAVPPPASAQIIQYPLSQPALTHMTEQRYCGTPVRASDGTILRSQTVLKSFRKYHPCPVTGKVDGVCVGWAIDHVIPLACGGCDAVSNLQWLPDELKSSKTGKDRFERKIYCTPMQLVK